MNEISLVGLLGGPLHSENGLYCTNSEWVTWSVLVTPREKGCSYRYYLRKVLVLNVMNQAGIFSVLIMTA